MAAVSLLVVAVISSVVVLTENGKRPFVADQNLTPFCGERALSHVRKLVGLGPRTAGSRSIDRARRYIEAELSQLGVQVMEDGFETRLEDGVVDMENIVAIIPGKSDSIIAVGGHYDTKDIPGANDGGSSAGLLLELCRCLSEAASKMPFNHTLWVIFFDGEDTGDTPETMFYGSRHLAERVDREGVRIRSLILVDMVGDKKLGIARDRNSDPRLNDLIWSLASAMGYGSYFKRSSISVLDDHIPFSAIGVPSSVVIDFRYGPMNCYWHTQRDDLDKIDPASLKIVGDVVYEAVLSLDRGKPALGDLSRT